MAKGLWGGPLNVLPKKVRETVKAIKNDPSVDWQTIIDDEGDEWLVAKLYFEPTEFKVVAAKIEFESNYTSTLTDDLLL